jgi:hypothetical protein
MILPAAGSGLFLFDLDNDDMMIDAIMESGYYGLGFNDTDLVFGVDVHIMMPHHDDASESMPDSNADMMMDEDKASPIFVRVEDLAEDKPATGGELDLTIGDLVTFSWVLEDGREQKLELELMFVTEEDGMDIAIVGFHVKDPVEKLDKNSEFDLDGDENIDMVVNLDQEDTTFSVDSVAFVSYWDEDLEETVDVSLDDADLVIDFETTLHYEVELISGDEYTVELDLEADEVMIEELEDFEDAFEDEDLSDLE